VKMLDEATYKTIHRSKKNVKTIALETGIKAGTLYVYGMPSESNGRDIPLSKLIPIMKIANRYDILKVLNSACGFLMVRVPRSARNKKDESAMISDYQKLCAETVNALIRYMDNPTRNNCKNVLHYLQEVMSESAGIEKRVRAHNQLELEL